MKKYYFTFGKGQLHEDCYRIIEAEDFMTARARMFELHGSKWAFQYTEAEWNENGITVAERYGLKLLK